MREKRSVYRVLVGKPEGKRPPGRPRHRCENNIEMDLREIGEGMNWIYLARYRGHLPYFVKTVMEVRAP
jgi:hypothetical protein